MTDEEFWNHPSSRRMYQSLINGSSHLIHYMDKPKEALEHIQIVMDELPKEHELYQEALKVRDEANQKLGAMSVTEQSTQ